MAFDEYSRSIRGIEGIENLCHNTRSNHEIRNHKAHPEWTPNTYSPQISGI